MSEEKAIYRLNFHKENADLENGTVIVNKIDLETVLKLLELKDNKINKAIEKLKEHKHDLDYEPYSIYKVDGDILFDLVKILEE